ncbi:heavy-metal-associated domain-containing protein [Tsukamurella sp. USMM236]|uniref:heavy-metal-associated domain-containing protein n=1 Tax=Tsukamurella sp. USMM236 TaxID=3081301 RepID=UPI003017CA51
MTTTVTVIVHGMHCGSCALLIDDALEDLPGVIAASTSRKQGVTVVDLDTARTTPNEVVATITELGYPAALASDLRG